MKRNQAIILFVCATVGFTWPSLLSAQSRSYVVNDKYIYEQCVKRAPEVVLFAQQDLVRATEALQLARQGKASTRVKEITLLANGHLVYPNAKDKPAFVKLCEEALQIAQQRLLVARGSPVPTIRGSLTAGDVGVLHGEAVVQTIVDANQAIIKGRFIRPARTIQQPREGLPSGWTKAATAEELLDFGDVAPQDQTALLVGHSTKDFQEGQKTDFRNVGVVVGGVQSVNTANGLIYMPALRATDIPGAIHSHLQALERERRKREQEAREREERERKKRDWDKDDKKGK